MRNIWTIARKEMNSYFRSPIAYCVLAVFAIIFGYFFYNILAMFVLQSLTQAQYAQMYGETPAVMNVNEMVIRPLLMNNGFVCLFLVPMITMRLFAEEKKTGTIELLMTSPVTDVQIMLGKFLAAVMLYATMLAITLLYMLVLFRYGYPGLEAPGGGISWADSARLLLPLDRAAVLHDDRNQLIAGSLTFFVLLLLWVLDCSSQYSGNWWGGLASYVSLTPHIENFSKGVIDFKDTVYYLSVIASGLFFSVRSVESVRWRA